MATGKLSLLENMQTLYWSQHSQIVQGKRTFGNGLKILQILNLLQMSPRAENCRNPEFDSVFQRTAKYQRSGANPRCVTS